MSTTKLSSEISVSSPEVKTNINIPKNVLIVIAIHGLNGSSHDFGYLSHQLLSLSPKILGKEETKLFHFCSKTNAGMKTGVGIELLGQRLLCEVFEWLVSSVIPELTPLQQHNVYLTLIGHSLGGHISQYFAWLFFSTQIADNPNLKLFIDSIIPCTFISVCTPHLGARKPIQNVKSLYRKLVHNFVMTYASLAGGLTCKELMLEDARVLKETLLYRMACPEKEVKRTMKKFRCWAISCLCDDVPVGCASAAMDPVHPYPELLLRKRVTENKILLHAWMLSEALKHKCMNVSLVFQAQQALQKEKIQVNDKKPFQELDSKEPYIFDSTHELEYYPEMLNQLNASTMDWNVIYMHFDISNSLFRQFVHPLAIGKKMTALLPQSVQYLGDEAGTFLVNLILADYTDHVNSRF
jgi:hypothetical protein